MIGLAPLAWYFWTYRQVVDRQLTEGQQRLRQDVDNLGASLNEALEEVELSAQFVANEASRLLHQDVPEVSLTSLRELGYDWHKFTTREHGKIRQTIFLTRFASDVPTDAQIVGDELRFDSNVFLNAFHYLRRVSDKDTERSCGDDEWPMVLEETWTLLADIGHVESDEAWHHELNRRIRDKEELSDAVAYISGDSALGLGSPYAELDHEHRKSISAFRQRFLQFLLPLKMVHSGETPNELYEAVIKELESSDLPQKARLQRAYHDILLTHKLDEAYEQVKLKLYHTRPSYTDASRNPSHRFIPQLRTSWIYLTTADGLMRIFPYHCNETQPWNWDPAKMDYVTLPMSDEKACWTTAYWDTAGDGFMVTFSHPVADSTDVFRTISHDVTLSEIEHFLRHNLATGFGRDAQVFLVDGQGGILIFEGHEYPSDKPSGWHPTSPKANAELVYEWLENHEKRWLQGAVKAVVGEVAYDDERIVTDIKDDEGQLWSLAWTPVQNTGWRLAAYQTNDSVAALGELWWATLTSACVAGILVTSVGVALAFVMTKDIRRMNTVLRTTDRMSGGFVAQLRCVARRSSSSEISRLASAMAFQAESEYKLVAKARHEIRNPLVHLQACGRLVRRIASFSQKALRVSAEEDRYELEKESREIEMMAHRLISATERIKDCVDLLRDDPETRLEPELVNIEKCIRLAAHWADTDHRGLEKIVQINCDYNEPIECFRVRLTRVFINVFINAGDAILRKFERIKDGRIQVSVTGSDDVVHITIQDNGEGIQEGVLPRVFEQGYTTAEDTTERGYGLAVVQEIVEQLHSGKVKISSTVGSGTTVSIDIRKASNSFAAFPRSNEACVQRGQS